MFFKEERTKSTTIILNSYFREIIKIMSSCNQNIFLVLNFDMISGYVHVMLVLWNRITFHCFLQESGPIYFYQIKGL